jgi:HEAT repeat protein
MAIDLSTRLSSPQGGSFCQHLARNAVTDPLPGVRLLNLLQLQEQFPGAVETREASRADLTDPSPWVRLSAARFIGDEGLDALEALAKDREVADQAAAEAVALLAAQLQPERAGPLLVDVLKSRTGDPQRQAIEALGRMRHAAAFGPLVVVMEHADPRTAAAAARALGVLGDSRAEASVLAVLRTVNVDLRLAAARALGQLGTVASVAPLVALLESRGLDAATRQTIRGAIASIQSRLVGAGAGQLTVASAGSESGRLSLANSAAGALTLTDDRESGS